MVEPVRRGSVQSAKAPLQVSDRRNNQKLNTEAMRECLDFPVSPDRGQNRKSAQSGRIPASMMNIPQCCKSRRASEPVSEAISYADPTVIRGGKQPIKEPEYA
jgi:hypothetical protein